MALLSKRSASFRACYDALRPEQQAAADESYRRFMENPRLVQFKPLTQGKTLHAARVGKEGRAIASVKGGVVYWLWIGFYAHAEYEKMVARLAAKGY
jgi:hypothetical protein